MSKPFSLLFQNKRALVTGASGFLGSHLTKRLVALGAEVFTLSRPSSDLEGLSDCLENITQFTGSLTERSQIEKITSEIQPQLIFHLAAEGIAQNRSDVPSLISTNVIGSINLIESLAHIPYERLIYAGSCFEYAIRNVPLSEKTPLWPLNPYAATKTMAWHFLNWEHKKRRKPVTTIRPFTFFGPYEAPYRLIPSIIRSIMEEKEIHITSGTQTRDYTYVEDMVEAFLLAAINKAAIGETFNIGSGHARSVQEITQHIRHLMKSHTPIHIGSLERRAFEAERLCSDSSKAHRLLGWRPKITFDEGVLKTAAWMRKEVAVP